MLDACDEVIIAQSCDKNFSVYRDRVGSLWVKTGVGETRPRRRWRTCSSARAKCGRCRPTMARPRVHIILDDPELRARWLVELDAMRDRINSVRQRIAAADPRLAFIGEPVRHVLDAAADARSRCSSCASDHAIYMADSGRFNVVGMGDDQIDRFIAAVVEALDA